MQIAIILDQISEKQIQDCQHLLDSEFSTEDSIEFITNKNARVKFLDKAKDLIINSTGEITEEEVIKLESSPDLLIVTEGKRNLADAISIGASYSEIVFINKANKDFSSQDLKQAIEDFLLIQRNFGV